MVDCVTGPGAVSTEKKANTSPRKSTISPEEARQQLDDKKSLGAFLSALVVFIGLASTWFAFLPTGAWFIVWIAGSVFAMIAVPFSVNRYIERRFTSPIKIDKYVIWTHKMIAMHAQSRLNGIEGGTFVTSCEKGSGSKTKSFYRYMYDNGERFVISDVPSKETRIYLDLDDGETPYIACWRKKFYRESLLTNPPARLPYESWYDEERTKEPYFYDIHLPSDMGIERLKLVQ